MDKWEIRRSGEVIAWGPENTFPSLRERKMFRADGYSVYVDGKVFRDQKQTAKEEKE